MRGDQKLKHDMALGASKKTATRRYQNNKKIEVIHLMEDLLLELGFELITKTLSGKNGVNRLESILEASRNGSSITFKSLTTGLVKTNHKLLKIVSKSKSEYSVNSKVFNIQKVVELNHPDLD
ncbi:hypothetical protein EIN_430130 [Entamoeba invadens IP1]|uniref:Uncharacterized protein n=1 Tax=Entamoeba invadens IP1 TaxID=370355 RepID=A0A0A1UHF2_ENTIV|nr:hypothetical protein EIN_430130 [Entamoeba invadens IP1]ELP95217.1 hypothetical protein EIN_430130 [Entamoeba invadens IP1]|eukprot:XP_004261988.1 hypothetical protein EIN_430130 [Entamoeba invadens IP1]